MKIKKEDALFTVPTGSRLYGTDTEKSDFDFKTICLPSLDELLLNIRLTNRKEKPEGSKASDKMQAGEIETEYVPLQIFLDDFFNGQTYAIEIAFAILHKKYTFEGQGSDEHVYKTEFIEQMATDLVEHYLNNSVKKMVGYAVAQSKLYGLKNERYTSILRSIDFIYDLVKKFGIESTLSKAAAVEEGAVIVSAMLDLPHVRWNVVKTNRKDEHVLNICGKQYYTTVSFQTILNSLINTRDTYGKRVAETEEGEAGVDWKALSHAIRITEQILELSATGKLVFPRPNAEFLVFVKNGNVELNFATAYLQEKFDQVDSAVANSVLKERTPELEEGFLNFKLLILKSLYLLN